MTDRIAPDPDAVVPKHLYKYRSLRGRLKAFARDLIVNQQLYFPAPPELNDPFEFRPVINLTVTKAQENAYLKGVVQRMEGDKNRAERRRKERQLAASANRNALAQSYRMTMDKIGVFSMSAKPLDLLMWPHYADNHTGICVQFDLWALVEIQHAPMPVTYSRERPVSNPMLEGPDEMLNKTALTKGLPWAYEDEWRLILNRRGGELVRFEQPIVSGVILGARINSDDRDEVLGWVRDTGRSVDVYQARFHDRDYALEIHAVDHLGHHA
jgi:hypothetical protein